MNMSQKLANRYTPEPQDTPRCEKSQVEFAPLKNSISNILNTTETLNRLIQLVKEKESQLFGSRVSDNKENDMAKASFDGQMHEIMDLSANARDMGYELEKELSYLLERIK